MTSTSVQAAVDALVEAIRAEVRDEFLAVLGGGQSKSSSSGAGRAVRASRSVTKKVRAKGAKRTPEELEALTTKTLAAIRKAPGSRAEQLAEALGVGTKELALPIAKLFDDKRIKSTGQRRGTKYFPR